MMGPKGREAAARFAERRKQEDEAPRLAIEVPALATLRITVDARRPGVVGTESRHVRVVVVPRAPALFLFPCGDPTCDAGGVDLTDSVMRELRARRSGTSVERECHGGVGDRTCGRVVHATLDATYR